MLSHEACRPIISSAVADVYDSYEDDVRRELLQLRRLIFDTAAETAGVGPIDEALKWGQPRYLTTETGSGSTIRLAPIASVIQQDYAMFFICYTDLVTTFRDLFGDALTYDGNRALLFRIGTAQPEQELRMCIRLALTHLIRKRSLLVCSSVENPRRCC